MLYHHIQKKIALKQPYPKIEKTVLQSKYEREPVKRAQNEFHVRLVENDDRPISRYARLWF